MCLTIPKKIIKINKGRAKLSDGNLVDIGLVPDLNIGDWVLVSNSVVLFKINKTEARKALNLLKGGSNNE